MASFAAIKRSPTSGFRPGGHGAWRDADGSNASFGNTVVPPGITLYFYIADGQGLPNSVGQKVDQLVNSRGTVAPVEIVNAGSSLKNYHLYDWQAGGYLNLKGSSKANENYLSTKQGGGWALSDILAHIKKKAEVAEVHWSACRSHETWADPVDFPASDPKYKGAWGALATQKTP